MNVRLPDLFAAALYLRSLPGLLVYTRTNTSFFEELSRLVRGLLLAVGRTFIHSVTAGDGSPMYVDVDEPVAMATIAEIFRVILCCRYTMSIGERRLDRGSLASLALDGSQTRSSEAVRTTPYGEP